MGKCASSSLRQRHRVHMNDLYTLCERFYVVTISTQGFDFSVTFTNMFWWWAHSTRLMIPIRIMTFCALKQMIESSNVCSERDLIEKSKNTRKCNIQTKLKIHISEVPICIFELLWEMIAGPLLNYFARVTFKCFRSSTRYRRHLTKEHNWIRRVAAFQA